MNTTPKFYSADGILRESFLLTTTNRNRFFTGTADLDTVDIQISIRGSGYVSDPDYIVFEGEEFTIPNPSSFPDGLDLSPGSNVISIRAISTVGYISAPAVATVILIQEKDASVLAIPPSGITLERLENEVKITVEEPVLSDEDKQYFRGVNFYASANPGGGSTGYYRINVDTVVDPRQEVVYTSIASLPVNVPIELGMDGGHAADPLYFNIVGSQVDKDDNLLKSNFDEKLEIAEPTTAIKVVVNVSSITNKNYYDFNHNRLNDLNSIPKTIMRGDFLSIQASDPVYYVTTAIYYDPISQTELESPYSPEVVGFPMVITVAGGSLPSVTSDQILNDMVLSINRHQPEIGIHPGSVLRDTLLDPTVSEIQRIRFIIDFVHRSQAFSDLLKIDDPKNTGESLAVNQSQYKTALKKAFYLVQDSDTQSLIDQTFDKLASKYGKTRLQGIRSTGNVTFYTTKRPDSSKKIPMGTVVTTGSTRFKTTADAEISLSTIASFYNGITGRYSVVVPVQAESTGYGGNIAPGQIKNVVNGIGGLSVTNENRMIGGTSLETNRELALRAQMTIPSVDVGTEYGYYKTAVSSSGVKEARIVGAGDPLMQRDMYDGYHRGGKVDVWVRGGATNSVTDVFAFSFKIVKDAYFEPIGSVSDLRFRVINSDLTEDNPIIEIMTKYGMGVRNETTGLSFNVSGAVVEDYNIVKLSTTVYQPSISALDVIMGDYRYRTSSEFVMTRQPVEEIESLTGEVSGVLDTDKYNLYRLQDPMVDGRSANSTGSLVVTTDSGVPSGDPIAVTNESHVLISQTVDYLGSIGINQYSIVVWDSTHGVYNGPFDPSPDYTIVDGTATSPIGIKRTSSSLITSGSEVLVNYLHDENFVVAYKYDFMTANTQTSVDTMKHMSADVLAKKHISTSVIIEATIIVKKGRNPYTADKSIRIALDNFINNLGFGIPFRPSDVVDVIKGVPEVSYILLPLTKMTRGPGSLILREELTCDKESDYHLISDWSTGNTNVYLILDPLDNATTEGGGPNYEYKGIFASDNEVTLLNTTPGVLGSYAEPSGFIIGDSGYDIPGFSDETTLELSYDTVEEQAAARKSITANRIIVGIPSNKLPSDYDWKVTYVVGEDSGVKSIDTGPVESIDSGIYDFTYDEDRI